MFKKTILNSRQNSKPEATKMLRFGFRNIKQRTGLRTH
jgi:hypothetical protein